MFKNGQSSRSTPDQTKRPHELKICSVPLNPYIITKAQKSKKSTLIDIGYSALIVIVQIESSKEQKKSITLLNRKRKEAFVVVHQKRVKSRSRTQINK